MIVRYTGRFQKQLRRLKRRYRSIERDLNVLLGQLQVGDIPGDRVRGLDDIVYKVRVKNSDNQKGKSGGYRVLYLLKTADEISLLTLYSKLDQADVSLETLRDILCEVE